jgi:16S rRNA processing protein RimM
VIGVQGVEDLNGAEALAGMELRVPVERLAALPSGVFYRHDLVGCLVETSGGRPIGVVVGIEGTMSGSRLVVESPRGDVLVPFATEICTTIDPASRRIVIDPPEGLLELNEKVRS